MNITNTASVIDSRDVIERIEELETSLQVDMETELDGHDLLEFVQENKNDYEQYSSDIDEYIALKEFEEQGKYFSDWDYGLSLIHKDYFEQYMDEMLEDCGDIPKNIPCYLTITVDYDALKMDYSEIYFDGEVYYAR